MPELVGLRQLGDESVEGSGDALELPVGHLEQASDPVLGAGCSC